ncbi:uncharacterized protein LOC121738082 [Aricia agestis]|uniref:uncharacterized protein LOC121738082 n=1 Tax=Aricia agestis TaxID=91739 RepID=UPI001C207C9B|nr:uncharacterized protein LOC121738082 [Aricia agestis]
MPRRVIEAEYSLALKRKKIEEPPSCDVSFSDDEALPSGIIFTDVSQKKWRLGKPIGRGSFGRIYLASDEIDKEVTKCNARYVVKIEPHSNGPLFVEVHCLIRTAQAAKVKEWCLEKKQKRLGMPLYIASGSFVDENTDTKYRFLVLPRYDIDLQKIISRTKVLDLRNVLLIALQILDVLEYLHSQGYTHSDIKSSNLMLGFDRSKLNKTSKLVPSFQKDTKLVLVPRKHKKSKPNKSRTSNYYDDEDFIFRERSSTDSQDANEEKRLASVKKKLRKILSDKDSRTLHRHHAFNLRQLSNYVNYEDMNSSICSDRSYQKLLDDFGNFSTCKNGEKFEINKSDIELHKEAVYTQSNGQVYLLDYGLASKFLDADGKHKDFGMDARKAHDGTLEYSSRDSHIGAHSRRSDLETLGYNILDWLTGKLPWKTAEVLSEPDLVHVLKKNFMADRKTLFRACFKSDFYPQFLEKYFDYITNLDFTEKPDYDYIRSLFRSELLRNNYSFDKELSVNFAEAPMSPSRKMAKKFGRKNTPPDFIVRNGIKKAYERENVFSFENDLKLELLKQTLNTSTDGIRKPCTSRNFFISDADLVARLKKSLMPHDMFGKKLSPKNLRSKQKPLTKRKGVKRHRNSIGKFGKFMGSAKQFSWAEILAGNPEDLLRKDRNVADDDIDSTCRYRIRKLSNSSDSSETNLQSPLLQKDYLQDMNPTYAMKEVIANLKKRIAGKTIKEDETEPGLEGYTPAMVRVYKQKEKNEMKEKEEAKKTITEKKETQTRCTRSMRSKRTKPEKSEDKEEEKKKSAKPKTDKAKLEETSNKEEFIKDEEKSETKKNPINNVKVRRSTRSSKTTKTTVKKTVTIDDCVQKSPKKTVRKTQVIVNRRRLRSSKRQK